MSKQFGHDGVLIERKLAWPIRVLGNIRRGLKGVNAVAATIVTVAAAIGAVAGGII